MYAVARLLVLAWQRRQEGLRERRPELPFEKPWCVGELERALGVGGPPAAATAAAAADGNGDREGAPTSGMEDFGSLLDFDFDFDLVDWSFWETGRFG